MKNNANRIKMMELIPKLQVFTQTGILSPKQTKEILVDYSANGNIDKVIESIMQLPIDEELETTRSIFIERIR